MCLAAAGAARSQEGPAQIVSASQNVPVVSANQQLANTVADRLRHNANLKNFRVDVAVADGAAELTGQVTDAAQRDEVLRTVQSVPGVERVRDRMTMLEGPNVQTAQATSQPAGPAPVGGMPPEPLPIYAAAPGAMPNPQLQPPPLPPNAWPTFAPYNNVSRVAYPNQYPYQAWPFIGPMYPFPKIPLGWRSVSVSWRDGYWWYGREASGHDWWRIRYW
jgi:BON domain-containing protein